MTSELQFDAPVKTRVARYYHSVTVVEADQNNWRIWCHKRRRWFLWRDAFGPRPDRSGEWLKSEFAEGAGSHAPCRTLKAFRRHLRRHATDLKGCKVMLVNRFVGHDISAQL